MVEPASVRRPSSSVVRRRQHFQTTSPLKLPGRIFSYLHIVFTGGGTNICVFYFDRISTLVAMAT